jgi:mono/diheme cytochrome c family protein
MRLISVTIVVFCLALPGAATAYGQQVGADLARGQALVTKQCASCHAVGRTGASPHETAPAFRTLSQRYKIEALEEALAEGLSSGHPDMPEFVFEADDVGAIIAYLNSIQDR